MSIVSHTKCTHVDDFRSKDVKTAHLTHNDDPKILPRKEPVSKPKTDGVKDSDSKGTKVDISPIGSIKSVTDPVDGAT